MVAAAEAGNPAEDFLLAPKSPDLFFKLYQGWNEAKMIVPAKMFSAMGVWTSLEPQLTTPQPQPLPTRRSCAPRKAKRLIADIETWLRAQN